MGIFKCLAPQDVMKDKGGMHLGHLPKKSQNFNWIKGKGDVLINKALLCGR